MIEIYLNPDSETLFEGNSDDKEYLKAVNSAKELLKELPATKTLKHAVLECYAQMSTKNKQDVEEALQTLIQIVNQDRNYVPALLGIAQAYIIRKEIPKARNQLKRIAKMTYNTEDAEEFERSWLLLADIYIQPSKFDLAQELLKRCLTYNKSCAKAWELLGFINEKDGIYRDAADHYESAWKMENESNPTIGFRLAFNYLKAKRYVEAIDICHKILALYPEYPKIRKDILDRARLAIRC
jgi:tetratricopeptide repeat protein 21B